MPTPFEKQRLTEMKDDFKKTLHFLGHRHASDEDPDPKEPAEEMFEESLKRKLSFIDSFSRLDSSIF
jgi:hypothetical protein